MEQTILDGIGAYGFPIILSLLLLCGAYLLIKRIMNDNKERETKLAENNLQLIENNRQGIDALNKLTISLEASNKTNEEISETNKLLANELKNGIDNVNTKIDKIIEKEYSK